MKRKWKILLAVVGLLVLAGGVVGAIRYNQRGIVTVQTGRASRQDLQSIVTASGEIKPRNYINIGSEAFGRITGISVKEGDRVKKGQILARIDSIQADADFNAQKAAVRSAEADSAAAEASLKAADDAIANAQATLDRSKADLERVRTQYRAHGAPLEEQARRAAGLRSAQSGARGPGRRGPRVRNPGRPGQGAKAAVVRSTQCHAAPHHAVRSQPAPFRRCPRQAQRQGASRWRGHQPAGARRRNRGPRRPELSPAPPS